MAVTATYQVTGTKTGDANQSVTLGPLTLTNTDAPVSGPTTQSFAAATFAAVTFPALVGSSVIKGVWICPPSANTGAITLKGVTGDTGIPIHKTEPTFLRLASVTASNFGILCVDTTVITFLWV
jgi:hypothetical protein